MSIRFLSGEDYDFFDYESVDNNELYDDLDLINKDLEDEYFDTEDADEIQKSSEYTGIQDY
jgi:hypothetical protein